MLTDMATNVEEAIQNLETRLRDATMSNDVDLHNQLLAETWLNTNANGSVTNKAQLLELLQSHPFEFLSIEDEDVVVRTYDRTAIVTGKSTRRRKGPEGSIVTQSVRFIRVYVHLETGWQVVAAQATPVI